MKEKVRIVIGHKGEVGNAFFEILKDKNIPVIGIDLHNNKRIIDKFPADVDYKNCHAMHIFIPFDKKTFCNVCEDYINEFEPHITIIHSTVVPGITREVWKSIDERFRVAYSPVRGQHNRLKLDLLRYHKFSCGVDESSSVAAMEELHQDLGFEWAGADEPETLEVVKLLDTTQFGVLISWSQAAKEICDKFNIDFNYVIKFGRQTDEFYGVRPEIEPGYIGGHCVRQNIGLLQQLTSTGDPVWEFLENILKRNEEYGDQLEKKKIQDEETAAGDADVEGDSE